MEDVDDTKNECKYLTARILVPHIIKITITLNRIENARTTYVFGAMLKSN